MSNDLKDNLPANAEDDVGGFAGGTEDSSRFTTRLHFDPSTCVWSAQNGSELPARPLLVMGTNDAIVRFATDDGKPEFIFKQKGKPFPSVDDLNDQVPQGQWPIGLNDKPEPPYKYNRIVYLLDEATAERLSYMNATTGMLLATGVLRTRVSDMRRLRGDDCYPVIELDSAPFKTKKWGLKNRPDFRIVKWKGFGPPAPALAAPDNPQLISGMHVVAEPSLSEAMADGIKY